MRDGKNAINDWWGMSTDMVDVDLSDSLPDGVRRLANILRDGIIKGDLDPFRCVIRDRAGSVVNDGTKIFKPEELMRLDWLCDNVDGVIPAYDDLLDRSKELVRLLGIYRESILPLPEDVVGAIEQAWTVAKGDSPEYFTLYKGKGSVGGEKK